MSHKFYATVSCTINHFVSVSLLFFYFFSILFVADSSFLSFSADEIQELFVEIRRRNGVEREKEKNPLYG